MAQVPPASQFPTTSQYPRTTQAPPPSLPASASPQVLPTTEFGRKYGRFYKGQPVSYYTPDDSTFPYLGNVPLDRSGAQRITFYGFTTEELQQLDCLPTRELQAGNLQNGILPIMYRENWATGRLPDWDRFNLYPLKNGNGHWQASHAYVWNLIQPCLRLASRMLLSVHLLPWVSVYFIPAYLLYHYLESHAVSIINAPPVAPEHPTELC